MQQGPDTSSFLESTSCASPATVDSAGRPQSAFFPPEINSDGSILFIVSVFVLE